jgi:NitT/TauT family transport system ATP-binding protein
MTGRPVVTLRGVGQEFHHTQLGRAVRILDGINLEVRREEILCVVGPSGCGKSTLLHGIGGFVPFSEGECLIEGVPAGPPNRNRGVVFQDYPIPEFLSAIDNVALGLDMESAGVLGNLFPFVSRKRRKANRVMALDFLASVGLAEHANKYPRELSGGQRQRVAIAQALAMKPKVLLMDEPFSGLDPHTREALQLVVLKLHRELSNTIFFVTHDLEEAVFLGNRVVVVSQFSEGRGAGQGATIVHEQALEEYKSAEVKATAGFATLIATLRQKFGMHRPENRAELARSEARNP